MEGHITQTVRLVIAAVNGVLFALGLYIVLEYAKFRLDRWKKQLKSLLLELIRLEREEQNEKTEQKIKEIEKHISSLKERLHRFPPDQHSLVVLAFGGLMIAVSTLALMSLLFPLFPMFQ